MYNCRSHLQLARLGKSQPSFAFSRGWPALVRPPHGRRMAAPGASGSAGAGNANADGASETWELVSKATDEELKRRRSPILFAACTGDFILTGSCRPMVQLWRLGEGEITHHGTLKSIAAPTCIECAQDQNQEQCEKKLGGRVAWGPYYEELGIIHINSLQSPKKNSGNVRLENPTFVCICTYFFDFFGSLVEVWSFFMAMVCLILHSHPVGGRLN